MSTKIIQLNDTDADLKQLPAILNTAIIIPKVYLSKYRANEYSGVLEVKFGEMRYFFPEMMTSDEKYRIVMQVKNVVTRNCLLHKKKKKLKEIAQKSYLYAADDEMGETAIHIYSNMDDDDKNSKAGIFLKNHLLNYEKNILDAIFTNGEAGLLKMYLDLAISSRENLLESKEFLDFLNEHTATLTNYLAMQAYLLQALNTEVIRENAKNDLEI